MILTMTPIPAVITIIPPSILKFPFMIRSTAKYTRIPVTTQMERTEIKAPTTSARYLETIRTKLILVY